MDFLKEVASSSPVPAGGAAAAYTTSLAIGLIYKVVLFEIRRPKDPDIERNFLILRREIEKLLRDVERLIKEDPEKYTDFAQSRRTGDKTKMKQSFSHVIEVSMKVLEKSEAALFWVDQLIGIVPKQMTIHLLVACELLRGAINGTVYVAKDNMQRIKARKKRETYLKKLNDLHKECEKRYRELMPIIP